METRDWPRYAVIALATVEAGWMAFDGIRALFVGDYVTPASGELGPWADLVSTVGIDPRSMAMKAFFTVYGLVWLGIVATFAWRRRGSRRAMLVAAIGALWYLPIGTLFSLLQIAILFRYSGWDHSRPRTDICRSSP